MCFILAVRLQPLYYVVEISEPFKYALEELFGTRKKLFDAYKQEIHDRKLDVRIADVDITDECLLAKFQNLNKYKKNDTKMAI